MYNYPKRPIKSFQDLEVYQKTLGISVVIVKRIPLPKLQGVESTTPADNCSINIIDRLHQCVLSLPILIATAHSIRFSNPHEAIDNLEKAMLNINLTIVYLEQFRDIVNNNIETEFFEEQIKNLIQSRSKILHLQLSWKKFMKITEGKNV